MIHRTLIDGVGKACGTIVYAVPLMDRVYWILDFFTKNGRPIHASEIIDSNPLEGGLNSDSKGAELLDNSVSTQDDDGQYLNCAQVQQKIVAEIGDETSAQGHPPVVDADRGSLVVDGGDGEAVTDSGTQVPPTAAHGKPAKNHTAVPVPPAVAPDGPQSPSEPHKTTANKTVSKAPLALWTPPEMPDDFGNDFKNIEAWQKGCLFCQLWAEAFVRLEFADVCEPTPQDRLAAFEFLYGKSISARFDLRQLPWWRGCLQTKKRNPKVGTSIITAATLMKSNRSLMRISQESSNQR